MAELPERWRPGDPLTAARFNQMIDAMIARFTGENGITVRRVRSRVLIGLNRFVRKPFRAQKMKVVEEFDDHLSCKRVDAKGNEVSGGLIYVLKPYGLRRTPFDGTSVVPGFTYAYSTMNERVSTQTSDSSTENQKITPDYYVGAIIYAIPVDENFEVPNVTPIQYASLIDSNGHGNAREWCKIEE